MCRIRINIFINICHVLLKNDVQVHITQCYCNSNHEKFLPLFTLNIQYQMNILYQVYYLSNVSLSLVYNTSRCCIFSAFAFHHDSSNGTFKMRIVRKSRWKFQL